MRSDKLYLGAIFLILSWRDCLKLRDISLYLCCDSFWGYLMVKINVHTPFLQVD